MAKKLHRLQKADSDQIDSEKRKQLQDKIMTDKARQDVVMFEYNNKLATETTMRQELINV